MGFVCVVALIVGVLAIFAVLGVGGQQQPSARRFTLRGLLLFVLLCAVWLSQIRFAPMSRNENFYSRDDLVVAFAWLVLAGFYAARRLVAPLVVHCVGLAFFLPFIAMDLAAGGRKWPHYAWLLSAGCFFGSFASLPFASLVFLGFLRRRPAPP